MFLFVCYHCFYKQTFQKDKYMKILLILSVFLANSIFTMNQELIAFDENSAFSYGVIPDTFPLNIAKNYIFIQNDKNNDTNETKKILKKNYELVYLLKNLSEVNTTAHICIRKSKILKGCFKDYFITQYTPLKIIQLILNKEDKFKAHQLSPKIYVALSLADYVCASSVLYQLYKKSDSNIKEAITEHITYPIISCIAYAPLLLHRSRKNLLPNLVGGALGYFDYKNINTKIQIFFDKMQDSNFLTQIFYELYGKEIVKPTSELYKDSFYTQRNNNEIVFESPAGNLILDNKTVAEMNNLNLNIHVLTTNKDSEITTPFDCVINIDVPELNPNGYMFDLYKHEAKKIARTLLSVIKNKKEVLINITSKNIEQNFNTIPRHELSMILLYMLGFINDQHKIKSCDTVICLDPVRFFTVHPSNIQLTQYVKNFHTLMLYGDKTDSNQQMNDLLNVAKNLLPTHPYKHEILEILQEN